VQGTSLVKVPAHRRDAPLAACPHPLGEPAKDNAFPPWLRKRASAAAGLPLF
jgi:hypothetical protein